MTETTQHRQSEQTSQLLSAGVVSAPLMSNVRSGESTPNSIQPPNEDISQTDKKTEFHWKFAEETHQYVRDYIKQADQKAAFFFAGSTALIAFLYKATLIQLWVKIPTQWGFIDMLSFVTALGLVISAFAFLVAVFPKLKGSKRGYVFFGAISEFESGKEYAHEVLQQDVVDLISAKLCHVHGLSVICGQKFYAIKVGQWSGMIGIAAMILLLLFGK